MYCQRARIQTVPRQHQMAEISADNRIPSVKRETFRVSSFREFSTRYLRAGQWCFVLSTTHYYMEAAK